MDTGHIDFFGDHWYGWRLKGRHLVSPGGQHITPQRLEGLLLRDQLQLQLAGFRSRREAERGRRGAQYGPKIKVVLIDLAEYRAHGVGAA